MQYLSTVSERQYRVVVEGVEANDLSLRTLRDLCYLLTEGAARSARLAVEGRSTARGSTPAWISRASDVHLTRLDQGSADLAITASRLVDVDPAMFAQTDLFSTGLEADATAFDLFLDAADDAAAGRKDSDRLDPGVLDVIASAGSLFAAGATRISFSGGTRRTPLVLDAVTAKTVRALADATPTSRIARVSGALDQLTASTQAFALKLDGGAVLRGYAGSVGIEALKPLLGARVVIEGLATFRPSGDAARVEFESIHRAAAGDVIWASLPHAEPVASKARPVLDDVGDALAALAGTWPGDETDEEVARALAEFG